MRKIRITFLILLCAVLAAGGCTQPMPGFTPTPTPMVTQPVSEMPASTAKGTVIDTREITNEKGGYYIPIPDSWMGRTSYEMYDDETYIYHITTDSSQRVINPVLLHVGAAYDMEPTNLYTTAEVFLQLDDVKFYYVPVADFPYTIDTVDADAYREMSDDIMMMLQSAWVIDESKWGDLHQPPPATPEPWTPFVREDATFDGIMLGTAKDTVLASMSAPHTLLSIDSQVWGATGETEEIYTYDFGTLSFLDGVFTGVTVTAPSIAGPRGFGVGDSITDVMASFCGPVEYTQADYTIYYRYNTGTAGLMIVPPSCYTYDDGTTRAFHADCYADDTVLTSYSLSELTEMCIYMSQFSFSFNYDASGTVTSFGVHLGAPAE